MTGFEQLLGGFAVALSWKGLLYCFIGCLWGTIVGVLPGLGPLAGMKLETLDLDNSAVEDLSPLKGMPLRTLQLFNCKKLRDLSPLTGMGLVSVSFPPEADKVDSLRQMKSLTTINGLPPVQFWKLHDAAKKKAK